jgi:hypothetical protein
MSLVANTLILLEDNTSILVDDNTLMSLEDNTSMSPEEKVMCETATSVLYVDQMAREAATQMEGRYVMTSEKSKQAFKRAYFNMLLFQPDIYVST